MENEELKVFDINEKQQSGEYKGVSSGELVNEINQTISNMQEINIDKVGRKANFTTVGYAPSYSANTTQGLKATRICSLYNAKGQGNYNICWAASIATIANYRYGTNISAIDVCNKTNNAYGELRFEQIRSAMRDCDLAYKSALKQLGYGDIRKNIDYKYPIVMSSYGYGGGHATVLYGYNVSANAQYIYMYNPGTNATVSLRYNSSGTSYAYNGYTWVWKYSLYYK